MTLAETRQLGIEFERRVQTLIPDAEFLNKLDTDTIYSFLNQYQDKYIHQIYRNLDSIPAGSKTSAHVESVLQNMLKSETISVLDENVIDNSETDFTDPNGLSIVDTARSITYPLPSDFYLYIRSVSNVTSTYSFNAGDVTSESYIKVNSLPISSIDQNKYYIYNNRRYKYDVVIPAQSAVYYTQEEADQYNTEHSLTSQSEDFKTTASIKIPAVSEVKGWIEKGDYNALPIRIIPNMLSSQNDVWKLIETPHDSLRILRYPAAILNTDKTISVIYDRYTNVRGIKIIYYKQPQHFDLMDSIPCELPMDAFDDLVTGAVDLYVQYAAGAEARKKQMQQQQAQEEKQNRKRNNDEDED